MGKMRSILALVLGISGGLFAQTAIYKPYKNSDMWSADTLFVGASFIYLGDASPDKSKWPGIFGSGIPITVALKGSDATWIGQLWANIEDPASGNVQRVYLFNNHDARGTCVDLRAKVSFVIQTNAQITFEYDVIRGSSNPQDYLPKYSGPNRHSDRHFSEADSDNMKNPNWRYGHRWSVVGRVDTGELEFGFEDNTGVGSDMDFDDVVFTVTNLEMGVFTRKVMKKDFVR
jgi:hypothetical protein